jgi:hypothetical protein
LGNASLRSPKLTIDDKDTLTYVNAIKIGLRSIWANQDREGGDIYSCLGRVYTPLRHQVRAPVRRFARQRGVLAP